jgi:hypothetical protein
MRNVEQRNGRWVEVIDLGPVLPSYQAYSVPMPWQPMTGDALPPVPVVWSEGGQ